MFLWKPNKPISLKSKYFGEYNLKINQKNTQGINCPSIDIDKKISISKKELEIQFKKSIPSYQKLINERLTNNTNKPSYIEIVENLKNEMI